MLTSSYPRFEGDIAGTFVESLAVEIARLGHDVHVLMPDDGTPPRAGSPGVHEHRFPYAPHDRLRVMGYAKALEGDRRLRYPAYAMAAPYALAGFAWLEKLTARHGCDVVHAHWVLPNGPIGAAVARALARPFVISLHGSDVYLAEKAPPLGAIAGWALGAADVVTACSPDLRRRAVELGAAPARARVVLWGASPERFVGREEPARRLRERLGIGPDVPVVLALGRLVYKKGFSYLIRAMPEIRRRAPGAVLVLAGSGVLAGELAALADQLGVADAVQMPGLVPSTEVPTYMAAADVFALPSIADDAGNVDGLPTAMLEAMAAGLPIVATDAGGIAEVLADGEHGRLVPQRSAVALAEAVGGLLAAPAERARMGRAARQLIEQRLNWAAVARTFVELYREADACA